MNRHARDAVIAVCVTGVVITAMVVTRDASALWLLFLLVLLAWS